MLFWEKITMYSEKRDESHILWAKCNFSFNVRASGTFSNHFAAKDQRPVG
jgi:hypothetical protein